MQTKGNLNMQQFYGQKRPLVLVILDGWGQTGRVEGNAIAQAATPNFNSLISNYPHCVLSCFGASVGLPAGQMGNSEVGHLNLGAGRIVYQELTRITRAIKDSSFFKNEALLKAVSAAKNKNKSLHLIGLLSDGGVHSHIKHLFALLELAARANLHRVFVHAFLDGRDVPPANAGKYFESLGQKLDALGCGAVATVIGRYYAMDRDCRWERTERAYNAMVYGAGLRARTPAEAVKLGYARGETDEFIQPTVLVNGDNRPVARVTDGDAVIFFNFRPDRARQITRAFVDRDFGCFNRGKEPPAVHLTCMTLYDKTIDAPVAFKPQLLRNTLGEVLSNNGLTQLRIAETEKYAHVTFFFNGGIEVPNPGEDRVLVPSPRVATYDLKPEMSAVEVTEKFLKYFRAGEYGVIIMNYANADMVGHTGDMNAAVQAVETVDRCLGRVAEAVLAEDGIVLITADHGNAEMMKDEAGRVHTAHTVNPVPFILISRDVSGITLRDGGLEDVAPTMLHLLGIRRPPEMTGTSLMETI
jgi:2,3-bisphosphoglycerate-independent phosphoglycerate mutase